MSDLLRVEREGGVAWNDQLTRQWHLLRRLESPRGATLRELAVGLPDDFPEHLRTLRRDLAAVEAPPAHPASVADAAGEGGAAV